MCMYLMVSCQYLHIFANIMSVYACMCHGSYYETLTPKMSKYEMRVCGRLFFKGHLLQRLASGVQRPPVLHQHVGHDLAYWLPSVGGGGALKKIKSFDHVNWKCVLQRPTRKRTALQSHRQSRWRPSSVSPGRSWYSCSYLQIQANTITYMQIQE